MFTLQELQFLFQMLDTVQVSGVNQKAMVVNLMMKIAQEIQKQTPQQEQQEE